MQHNSVHFVVFFDHSFDNHVNLRTLLLILTAGFLAEPVVFIDLSLNVPLVLLKLLEILDVLGTFIYASNLVAAEVLHVHVSLVFLQK